MSNSKVLRPFGWKDKVGYMIGNVANDLMFIFASLYLQVFYTDVLGINAALVGTMFLLSSVLHINYNFSKIVAMVLVTVGNYVISKIFVFKKGEN